jgi:hypothetical protein
MIFGQGKNCILIRGVKIVKKIRETKLPDFLTFKRYWEAFTSLNDLESFPPTFTRSI